MGIPVAHVEEAEAVHESRTQRASQSHGIENARTDRDKWIINLYDQAMTAASEDEKRAAQDSMKQFLGEKIQ